MTKEIFEKAQFGDRFVTREGQEALFLRLTENSEWQFANFYVKDWGLIRVNRENGKWLNGPDTKNDIVGKMSSLPSNLDEAAWKYGLDNQSGFCSQSVKVDCFKAGAEWMAGQGYTVNGIVICDKELTGGYKDIVMSIPDELKVDDKVTIQIRKR